MRQAGSWLADHFHPAMRNVKSPSRIAPPGDFLDELASESPEEVDREAIVDQAIVFRSQRHFVGDPEIETLGNA